MSLAGQSIILTGASAGIGHALALELARDRTRLTLTARHAEKLAAVADECRRLGAEVLVVPTDVTDEDQCRQLVEATVKQFGQLDILINNAGRAMWTRFEELASLDVMEDVMRLNYLGSVYCSYYALPHLKQSRGQLVAMASVSGLTGVPLLSGYAASKHAVIGFFESLRIELADCGVSVTIVAPDFVQSEILERAVDAQGQPLGFSPLDQKKLPTAQQCAARIRRALLRRERLVLMSSRSKNLRWGKLLCPGLVDGLISAAMGLRPGKKPSAKRSADQR